MHDPVSKGTVIFSWQNQVGELSTSPRAGRTGVLPFENILDQEKVPTFFNRVTLLYSKRARK